VKAIAVREFGGPEVLGIEDLATPQPAAGQVLVRIEAAGVNPADTYVRSGTYAVRPKLPYTPGSDGAGVVEAVGEGVKGVKPGDRVFTARSITGTYAEYALALEGQVAPLPERISFAQGAGIFVPYGTAYRALVQLAHSRAAETLLVHGASGGVGIAAVQIASAMGMTVIGTASTAKGRDLVRAEGARHALDHSSTAYRDEIMKITGGRGVDVILEMLANVNLGHDLKLLAQRGRVVVIGSRGDVTITPRDLMAREAAVYGMVLWSIPADAAAAVQAALVAGLGNGTLRPVVGKEMPLADAPRAHKEVMQPGAYGKIVLIP
jgi:NADPH2:quinone reductase